MSSNPTLTSSECPNCGAPIDLSKLAPDQTQVECEHCGSMLNLPNRARLREIQAQTVVINVSSTVTEYTPPAKASRGSGCIGLAVALMVLGVVAVVLLQTGVLSNVPVISSIVPAPRVWDDPYAMPRANDSAQELLYLTLGDDKSAAVSFDTARRVELWRSPGLSSSFTDITLLADDERAYIADEDRLLALNRTDGTTAWEISLPYALNESYHCGEQPCLRLFGPRVVARLKDGSLLALDSKTGKTEWSKQLNYTSGGVFDALGNPAAIDTADGKNSAATMFVFDAQTGEVKTTFEPRVRRDSNYTAYANAEDEYIPSPDGKSVYVVSDASTSAVWKYDWSTGELVWLFQADRTGSPDGVALPFIGNPPYIASDDALYIVQGSSDAFIVRIDAATGEATRIFDDARHNISALTAVDGVLVIAAQPNFDNEKRELWGLDGKTGDTKWKIGLKTSHSFDDFIVHPSGGALFLAQTQWEDGKLLIDVLDPRTGVSKGQVVQERERADLNGSTFTRDTAWLNISSYMHEIDLASGQVRSVWP